MPPLSPHVFAAICEAVQGSESARRKAVSHSRLLGRRLQRSQHCAAVRHNFVTVLRVLNIAARSANACCKTSCTGRMPVPVILIQDWNGLRILDGNHRLAAIPSFANAESGRRCLDRNPQHDLDHDLSGRLMSVNTDVREYSLTVNTH